MTDQEHTPTEQETAIYDALTAGDHDTIDDMRQEAYATPPDPDREAGEPTPAEQFEQDHAHAHAHYQADHETPETDRIEHTADAVEDENAEAT